MATRALEVSQQTIDGRRRARFFPECPMTRSAAR